jgi:hypothetical protein
MNEEQIADLWMTFKEFLDKKHIELAAEKYIDLLADYGVSDEVLQDCIGNESHLDNAINYYLDVEDYETFDDEDIEDWD